MKKTGGFLLLLAVVVMVSFSSCKKDEKDKKNELKYDGKTFDLSMGELEYYGDYYDSGAFNFDILLASDTVEFSDQENYIYFELFTSSSTDLLPGTYTFNATSMDPSTFDYGSFALKKGSYSDFGELTGGTVKVSKSGTNYEIIIDCDASSGKKITGYFKGPLEYTDQSVLKSLKAKRN